MEERKTSELKSNKLSTKLYGDDDLTQDFIDSVDKKGILEPITIKDDGTILSGHRRWGAAKSLGLERVPVDIVTLFEDDVEIEIIIDFNRHREKTVSQKLAEAEAIEKIEKVRSAARKNATQIKNGKPPVSVKKRTPEKGRTSDKVAKKTGFGSGTKYEKAKTVKKAADAGDKVAQNEMKKLDAGDTSVDAAHKKLLEEQRKADVQLQKEEAEKNLRQYFKKTASELTRSIDKVQLIIQGDYTPQHETDFLQLDSIRNNFYRVVRLSAELGIDAPKIWETYNCKVKFPKKLGISKDDVIEDANIIE